jgi:GNAT superfamily N-acetyltransferase
MEIKIKKKANATYLTAIENGKEVGAIYLYLIRNSQHKEPYALLEDLLVKEEHRGKGVGPTLVKEAIKEAKRLKCYKIIGTSRFSRENVHRLYEKIGLKRYGIEFRLDL